MSAKAPEDTAAALRRLRDELELFRLLGGGADEGPSVDRLLGRFLDRALKVFHTRAGTVFTVDPQAGELVFQVVRGRARQQLRGRRMPLAQGIAGWVARTGRPLLVRDVRRDRRWNRGLARYLSYPTQDILAVPLRSPSGQLVGVVELLNRRGHTGFTAADLEHLQHLGGVMGALLENARLWDETRRTNQQLRLLHEVSALVASSLDVKAIQRRTVRAAIALVDCEAGSLLRVEPESGELYFEVAVGKRASELRRVRLGPGEGIAGWVVQRSRAVIIPDCESDARWSRRVDRRSRFSTRDMVCVPVRTRDRVLGVLQALNKRRGRFDQDDLKLLQSLADSVAMALENSALFGEVRRTLVDTTEALAESIEVRDAYTGGHTRRVVEYSLAIARQLGLEEHEQERLRLAAILHDIGKIGVDDAVLRKPGRLDEAETRQMKRHPKLGVEILNHIRYLSGAMPGIRSHHERFDGEGYPDRLVGEGIPTIARIIAVADTYDAMTSDRPYRRGLPARVALAEIRRCIGSQFDPDVARAFLRAHRRGEIVGDRRRPRGAPKSRTRRRAR